MGKNLISQRRGRGTPTYKFPAHTAKGEVNYPVVKDETISGKIVDIIHSPHHSSPLAKIEYSDGTTLFSIAPEGIRVEQPIKVGSSAEVELGNVLPLDNIPEGTLIHNIEGQPGDGGKFVRASGVFARVFSKTPEGIIVIMPSKKKKIFNKSCRAAIGAVAGGGRLEKPFVKAGTKFFKMKAKNKLYPRVCGQSMNAVDHPHGGSRSSKKNYPYCVSRNAPPGAKVGLIAARRTGRRKK